MSAGRVALVGAGPGDPALLTLRAAELLRAAEVVAHDELVSESILAMVPATAELLSVGRRAGHGETRYRLHPDVLAHARAGRFVVRLKAGDPLVFGRGGEEAQELAAAGIPFEIVPGISAALGAAAYAGLPLTHREHAAQVVIATGHRGDAGLPLPETSAGRTLVLYMGTRELEKNLAEACAAGWPTDTPAALIVAATTPEERIVVGTLATLAERAALAGVPGPRLPALVVVGRAVALREAIAWRERLPLHGRRVIVARACTAPSGVALALRTLGADVVELPHVERAMRAMGDASAGWSAATMDARRYAAVVASEDAASAEAVTVASERATPPARWPSRVDLVMLAASSAARALYALAPACVRAAPAVAMGERTASAARSFGVRQVRIAPDDSVDALVSAALETLGAEAARATSHAPVAEVMP